MSDGNGALPEGWEATTVEGISNVVRGGSPRPAGDPKYFNGDHTPWITVREITKDAEKYLTSTETCLTAEGRERSRFIESGTLLLTNSGATLGVPKITKIGGCINDGSVALLGVEGDSQHYMYHYLRTLTQKLRALKQGAAQPNLNTTIVKEIEVPLPPLGEQRRIVSKIESLQERSSRARRALSEVGPLLEQFRQSVLRAAFSGRLTADWRAACRMGIPARPSPSEEDSDKNVQATEEVPYEPAPELLSRIRTERRHRWEQSELAKYEAKGKQPPKNWQDKYKEPEPVDGFELEELPDGWQWSDFDELALIDGGLTRHKEKRSKATEIVPLISVAAVQHGYIDSSQVSEIGLLPADGDKATLEVGDLLVVEGNGSLEHIGRAALWDGSIPNVRHQNHLIRVRPTLVDSRYALHWLASPLGRRNLVKEATSATGLYNLSLGKVGRVRIPLAPLEEQAEIVRLVDEAREAFRDVGELRGESESALTQLDQSILAKAFRGELVPQDPRDEPASELLARIRTTRETTGKRK